MITTIDTAADAERSTWHDLPPWQAGPLRLVSLWNMLRLNAHTFVALMRNLKAFEVLLTQSYEDIMQRPTPDGLQVAEAIRSATSNDFSCKDSQDRVIQTLKILRELALRQLDQIGHYCETLYLASGQDKIARMRAFLAEDSANPLELHTSLKELGERIEDDLKRQVFFYIPPDRSKFFPNENDPPFGDRVRDKFPKATGDIFDATICLGCGRSTAAVFHLMCVTEIGIRRLAKRLNVAQNHVDGQNWQTILRHMANAIQGLPTTNAQEQARRDRYAGAVAHLHNVKNAWRNPTMHGRRRFTQEEAEAIYENVKAFMHYLATWRN